jgi:methyl-accepting chemotaxis protein
MGWLFGIWGRISVRGKIIGTVALVTAAALFFGAAFALNAVSAAKQRGRYLDAPLQRYQARIEAGEMGAAAVAYMIATDPGLVAALEAGDEAATKAAADRLAKPLEGTLAPERLVLSDAAGNTFPVGRFKGLTAKTWREYRMYADLVKGPGLQSNVAIIARKPYLVSGAQVRSTGGQVIGAVLIARELENVFWNIAKDSHDDPPQQHRLSLLGNGKVYASALNKDERDELPWADKHARFETADGPDDTVPVVRLQGHEFDLSEGELTGYDRKNLQTVGKLLLLKQRDREASAWAEYRKVGVPFGSLLFGAVVIGYILAVAITRPLRRYIRATQGLARGQGDLTQRLEVTSRDELGSLAGNLNRVFAKIHTLAAGVQRSAFQVNASSGEISTVSKQMLDGAKEQAGKISNSTAAVTELSSSIQQVAENAAEATRTAQQTGQAVQRAISRLGEIRSTVEEAANRISALGESGKRIGNIVEVIRQISEQTSMLALNAAIEAAHAGEHGRGFAVVADEVSSLAKRTGQSAKDIEDLIATIRDQTTEAVRVMGEGTREVEEGTGLVEATLADLQSLVNVINDTAAAVQEQAVASDEIARNMDAVQRITSNVVASSEQAVAQGDQLLALANELEQSVGGFKIDPERVALDEQELKALPEAKT